MPSRDTITFPLAALSVVGPTLVEKDRWMEPPDNAVNEPISAYEADKVRQVLSRLGERIGQELKLDGL